MRATFEHAAIERRNHINNQKVVAVHCTSLKDRFNHTLTQALLRHGLRHEDVRDVHLLLIMQKFCSQNLSEDL